MKILIVGAGTVGSQLAARLSEEGHDIIVVDKDFTKLRALEEYYDLQTIEGDATSVEVLRRAGAEDAKLVIAVANVDTVNVMVCALAAKLDKSKSARGRIARIRESGCFQDHSVLHPGEMGVDRVIFPEEVAAREIISLLMHPYADQTFRFLKKHVEVVGLCLNQGHSLLSKTIGQLPSLSKKPFRLVAVHSETRTFIPINRQESFRAGDTIFISALANDLSEIVEDLGFDVRPLRKVFIYGGTNIGMNVARQLEHTHIRATIIEPDRNLTKLMAFELQNALVLHGEGTDSRLLEGEGVHEAEVFIAATQDENANLLSCLLAKKLGARKSVAVVTKPDYVPLIGQLDIDSIISQRLMTINRIMQYVRQGAVTQVEEIVEGLIQGLEFQVTNLTQLTGIALGSEDFRREFPAQTILGGLIRQGEVMIPEGSTTLEVGDRVVVFCTVAAVPELEKFFALGG
jgi:trk system potassium uptake protein TrkA